MPTLNLNGSAIAFSAGERLLDVINRGAVKVPQVCYHPQLGPIQTCDTCMVEVDGKLVRACATAAADGMKVNTESSRAVAPSARHSIAFSATTCSTAPSATTTTATARCITQRNCWPSSTRKFPSSPSPTNRTSPIPSIATIPTSASSADAAWRPARMSRSTKPSASIGKTLTRACCGMAAHPSANRAASPAATASLSARAMRSWKESMLGDAGYFTALPAPVLERHDRDRQRHRAGDSVTAQLWSSLKSKPPCASPASSSTKTVCTYCGVGCSFDIWTHGPPHSESRTRARPRQRHLHLHQRQIRLGLRQQPRPPDHAADPRGRQIPRSHLGRSADHWSLAGSLKSRPLPAPIRSPSSLPRSAPTKRAI